VRPQGLRNNPLYLKFLIDKVLGDLPRDAIPFADDIVLLTNGSMKKHLPKLSQVVTRLREENIKIRPSKISVARQTIKFLRVVWTKDKISIQESKTREFKKLPSPNTPKEQKVALANYSYQTLPTWPTHNGPLNSTPKRIQMNKRL
jgi:hypothetical protein